MDKIEGKKKTFIRKTKIYMISLKLTSISGVIEEKVIMKYEDYKCGTKTLS